MDVSKQIRISSPECFVCRWAGRKIIIWPQSPVAPPIPINDHVENFSSTHVPPSSEWSAGEWATFIKVEERIELGNGAILRSKHTYMNVCGPHWFDLEKNWVWVAWEEAVLEYRWHAYLDRMEQ